MNLNNTTPRVIPCGESTLDTMISIRGRVETVRQMIDAMDLSNPSRDELEAVHSLLSSTTAKVSVLKVGIFWTEQRGLPSEVGAGA